MTSGWERHLEMHPEYTLSFKLLRRMMFELVCFHTINWAINCLTKIVRAKSKLAQASKYHSFCSLMVVPAELANLELEGLMPS
jgi:hypothetical protein